MFPFYKTKTLGNKGFIGQKGVKDEKNLTSVNPNLIQPYYRASEAVVRKSPSEQIFLKISQISKENSCVGVSF